MRDNSILFVAGDEEVQQHVYDTYEFGYWSAGFDAILEKNGFLDFETAKQGVLAEPETLRQYDVVLVAWLPPTFWEMAYLRALWEYDGLVFLEGPLPGFMENMAGVAGTDGQNVRTGDIKITDVGLRERVSGVLGDFSSMNMMDIQPKTTLINYSDRSDKRWDGDTVNSSSYEFSEISAKICKSYAVAYAKRYINDGEFFEQQEYDSFTTSYLVDLLSQIEDREQIQHDELRTVAKEFERKEIAGGEITDVIERFSQVDIDRKSLNGQSARDDLRELGSGNYLFGILIASMIFERSGKRADLRDVVWDALNDYVAIEQGEEFALSNFKDVTTYEVGAIGVALSNIGKVELSEDILDDIIQLSFDWEKGLFKNIKIERDNVEDLGTYSNIPYIPMAFLHHAKQPIYEKQTVEKVRESYDSEWVERYQSPPYFISKYTPNGCDTMVSVEDNDTEWPLIFRRGNVIATSSQILSYIVHFHTMHPPDKPQMSLNTQPLINIETILFQTIHQILSDFDIDPILIANWPYKQRFCFTLRHDVDRIPTEQQFSNLTNIEENEGIGVTWFWLPNRVDSGKIRQLREHGHEIALHSKKINQKSEERSQIEKELAPENEVFGEAVHGAGESDGQLGHASAMKALNLGFDYTDSPGLFTSPYHFVRLTESKTIESTPLVQFAPSFCIDTEIDLMEAEKQMRKLTNFVYRNEGYLSFMNHPDINHGLLRDGIESLPENGRISWTHKEISDWWNRTHRREALAAERVADTREETVYRLAAEEDVDGLEVRIPRTDDYCGDVRLTADGEAVIPEYEEYTDDVTGQEFVRVRVDLDADEPVELRYSTDSLPAYEEIPPRIPDDITGPRAEPDYLLPRVSKMTQVLANFAGVSDLTGKSVLDAGCGYGPFTMALYLSDRPARAVGADISEKYVRAGNQLCAETGMDDVEFVQSVFRELTDMLDERFDVLIVNNSINFLTSRKAYKEAIREFYEILEPGGAMIILTPNRYHLEEAFTGLKGVQFLPDRIADWYVRKKGIRDGYDDIRLPSSFELIWWLRRTGFENVRVVDAYQFTTEGWRRHFKPRFYVTARKPK